MKDTLRHDYRDRIVEEAAEWFARLQDPEVSTEDRVAFADWLSASSEHIREYLALTSLHTDIGELAAARTVEDLVRLAGTAENGNVVPGPFNFLSRKVEKIQRETSEAPQKTGRNVKAWFAVAASVALIALVGVWWLRPDANKAAYTTAIGEQKSFPLPDGSLVTLNAVSNLQVRYTERSRDIQLLSGEALFNVAKNPRRPFRVITNDSVIQAVGTRFNVYHRRADTTVTVVEGTVEVQKANEGMAFEPWIPSAQSVEGQTAPNVTRPIRVTKGQRAHVAAQDAAITVRTVDVGTDMAWRERRLIFESRPLRDVVAEFNLYNESPIEIRDPALDEIQVSGSFYANDPQSFALFLEEAKLASTDVERERILLLPRRATSEP